MGKLLDHKGNKPDQKSKTGSVRRIQVVYHNTSLISGPINLILNFNLIFVFYIYGFGKIRRIT